MVLEIVRDEVIKAIKNIYLNDTELLQNGFEWAITHRLAVYLENSFSGWNVDCEYTKMGGDLDIKTDSHGDRKRPDIVIHKRGRVDKEYNLLVIEVKYNNDDGNDDQKLIDFTSEPNGKRLFQYYYGLAVSFNPELRLNWYENGREIND